MARSNLADQLEALGTGVLWGQLWIAPPSSAQAAELRDAFEEERAWQLEHLGWLPLMGTGMQWSVLGRCVVERSFLLVGCARDSTEAARVVFAHRSGALHDLHGRLRELEAYLCEGRMLGHERHVAPTEVGPLFELPACDLDEVPRFATSRPERALVAALDAGDDEAAQEALQATLASYPIWSRCTVARRAIAQAADPSSELARDCVDTLDAIERRSPLAQALSALLARGRDASSRVSVVQLRALGLSGAAEVDTTWHAAIPGSVLTSLVRGVAGCREALAAASRAHFDDALAQCAAVQAALCAARVPDASAPWPVRCALWYADALERRAVASLVLDADGSSSPDPVLRELVAARLATSPEPQLGALFNDLVDEVVARLDAGLFEAEPLKAALARACQAPTFDVAASALLVASLDREEAALALGRVLRDASGAAFKVKCVARAALRSLQLRRYVEERGLPASGDAAPYRVASREPDTSGWRAATLGWLRVIWGAERRFDFDRRHEACGHGVWLGDPDAMARMPALERAEQARQRKL